MNYTLKETIKILNLEDSFRDSELINEIIADAGIKFKMDLAENQQDFIALISKKEYDIILADFKIPGFDAFSALKKVMEICPESPFIVVSGSIGEETAIELIKSGAIDYVLKNNLSKLPHAVKRALKEVHQKQIAKQALEQIKSNEIKYRTLTENIPDIITRFDSELKHLYINPVIEKITGFQANHFLGKTNEDIGMPEELVMKWNQALTEVFQSKEIKTIDFTFNAVDGPHFFSSKIVPEFDDNGKVNSVLSVARDLTEYRKAEEALRETREQFELLFNSSIDAVLLTSPGGKIYSANAAACILFQRTEEELCRLGRDCLIEEADPRLKPALEQRNRTGKFVGELTLKRKDNTKFEAEISSAMFTNKEGEKRTSMIIRDISERINYEKQLVIEKEKAEEGDRLKTAFLHNISHEIRTPLNAIVGFAALLVDDQKDMDKQRQYKKTILSSSDHLLSIISDIMNIATIEAGQIRIHKDKLNINSLLFSLQKQFDFVAKEKGLTFSYHSEISDKEATIFTDKIKLKEILTNLISNAIKFTKKGSVKCQCKMENSNIVFQINDTGIGISSELHSDIFKRFRQADMSDIRQYSGLGLGLSIAKAYVDYLGGKIWLNSIPGKGSDFYVSIPFTSVLEVSQEEDKLRIDKTIDFKMNKTVLIAEDDKNNYQLLEAIMSTMNFNILHAKNGREAVEICETEQHIDLILMDIKMPVLDGFMAAKKIKAIRPSIIIIAQTAYASDHDEELVYKYGCDDYIPKPFSQDQLISKVINHL